MSEHGSELDRELADLPPELRWREWMWRVEPVLFASASPVPRADLARLVGQGASVDLLIDDIVADCWMRRTRPTYAPAIRAAADAGGQALDLREFDIAVLAAIAYEQQITRDGLREIFGREIYRDLIGRLHARGLIATGPRAPRPGAPCTFVTAALLAALIQRVCNSGATELIRRAPLDSRSLRLFSRSRTAGHG